MPGVEEAEEALVAADEAMTRFDVDALVAHLSTAIRELTAAGDNRRAAMTCVRLGGAYANFLGNPTASRAWFSRATRLVEQEEPCIEQGWVAIAAMGCDVDDPAELLARSELALERSRRFGDVNLETKALADAGLAKVQAGLVTEGMAMLDEAMALACGPADNRDAAMQSVCSFFTACCYAADFERAESWTGPLRQHGLIALVPPGPLFLSTHCDSVQATLLVEVGRWGDAESVLLRAKANFESLMGAPSWHADIGLADLRVRQGRLTDAEALLLGKDQSMHALLPAARLHLARGELDLARAAAQRGLRAMGDDRLRCVELLTALVDVELARGDLAAARVACELLGERSAALDVAPLRARAAMATARVAIASGSAADAVAVLEDVGDRVGGDRLPWVATSLRIALAEARDAAGDRAGAVLDARAARAALTSLDVVLPPETLSMIRRLAADADDAASSPGTAELARDGKWWTVSAGGTSVRLQDTKGLRYLAELLARPGVERHALDLVDRVEGVAPAGGPDRRSLGDAGEVLDGRARAAYRVRIEALRADADEALAAGRLEAAEAVEAELDALVGQLAQAFGLGGRARRAASVAERARLNVTRALRSSIARLQEALPAAGAVLDRRVRTGLYCAYEPDEADGLRWIVQT